MGSKFSHGQEIRAEEIALHQKFISAMGRLQAAEADGDEREVRRLRPVVERARKRWLQVNNASCAETEEHRGGVSCSDG